MYYLNSRYYDPEIGRFINADDVSILAESKDLLNGLNLFAYCNDNPVIYYDPNGNFFWLLLPFLLSGFAFAIGNTLVQLGSDLVNLLLTGKWESGWEDYLGAFVGGFAGGVTFVLTNFNLAATFAVIAGVENFTTSLLTNASGRTNYTLGEIIGVSLVMAAISFGLGKFGGAKVFRITTGRNSYFAVFKSGLSKLVNNAAHKMSAKVFLKGIIATFVLKYTSTIGKGIWDAIT